MTDALFVLAALLTLLQLVDGWTTYQALKLGGKEANPIVAEIMDTLGVYPTLVIIKVGAAAAGWAFALMDGDIDVRAAFLVLLMALMIWFAVANWQELQKLKGK